MLNYIDIKLSTPIFGLPMMKLVYLPLLAVNNIVVYNICMLFGLVPVYVSVKILYFHQVLEQKNTKQKS